MYVPAGTDSMLNVRHMLPAFIIEADGLENPPVVLTPTSVRGRSAVDHPISYKSVQYDFVRTMLASCFVGIPVEYRYVRCVLYPPRVKLERSSVIDFDRRSSR
jgi:hypothetical protein